MEGMLRYMSVVCESFEVIQLFRTNSSLGLTAARLWKERHFLNTPRCRNQLSESTSTSSCG